MITMKEIDVARASADHATEYLRSPEIPHNSVRYERALAAKQMAEEKVLELLKLWWEQGCVAEPLHVKYRIALYHIRAAAAQYNGQRYIIDHIEQMCSTAMDLNPKDKAVFCHCKRAWQSQKEWDAQALHEALPGHYVFYHGLDNCEVREIPPRAPEAREPEPAPAEGAPHVCTDIGPDGEAVRCPTCAAFPASGSTEGEP